jgi:hypothetical protein
MYYWWIAAITAAEPVQLPPIWFMEVSVNYVSFDSVLDDMVIFRDEICGERFGVVPKVVLSEFRSAIGDHEFFFENQDGRIVLIFPLGNRVLIDTSDI